MYIMYMNNYVIKRALLFVSVQTIKARSRSGTRSLELTIPVKIVDELKIHEGDVFSIETKIIDGKLILVYKREYSQD